MERYVSAMDSRSGAFSFRYVLIVLIGIALTNVPQGTGCDARELPNGNLCNLSAIQFTVFFLRVYFVFEHSSPRR